MPDAKPVSAKRADGSRDPPLCLKCGGPLFGYGFQGMAYFRCERCGAIWLDESLECDKCS